VALIIMAVVLVVVVAVAVAVPVPVVFMVAVVEVVGSCNIVYLVCGMWYVDLHSFGELHTTISVLQKDIIVTHVSQVTR